MKKLSYLSCLLAFGSLQFFCAQSPIRAQEIVRIEEDWELQVTQPDEQLDAPQLTMMMFPVGEQTDLILQLDLNHATYPEFARGGLQVRASFDDETISDVRLFDGEVLAHNSETITWTQVAQKAGSGFYYGINQGSGTSWGSFGGEGAFVYVTYADAGSSQFENYDAQSSIQNSGAIYASNRVASLVLKKLRIYRSNGSVSEWDINASVL